MSHSLIVPRHMAERRRAALADPGIEVTPRVEGRMLNPDQWFEEEKERIRARCGDFLGRTRVTLNRVLVALFVRPKEMELAGGFKLEMPDSVIREDIWQGVAGLVLKLGPRCFEDSDVITWTEADRYTEGDWVLIRRSDAGGFRVRLNGVDCIMFNDERGVKAVVPRPDVIF